ncbi:hypothetical protein KIH39_00135 [Telmatocola sphagniphila]|uniref:Uncharacterized protein n=1 Tax=Telmatocola sphagniphila TaxID=1123043 RepID=A0A8E6EY65_9BACT|nr:hypothetical protein [Telmatocola sphagniphila]QVL32363.1 hypothetical protein KIH39_00135 [Telmatocola sphagniphila]
MKWNFFGTNVVILGAGFSSAATEGRSPLMRGFFDKLERDNYPELYDFVNEHGCNQVCTRIEDANVENVLLALDQTDNCPSPLRNRLVGNLFEKNSICDQLAYYTIMRFKTMGGWSPENWAVQTLAKASERTTVISMNYDVLADSILSSRTGMEHFPSKTLSCPHCKMRYLLSQACNCTTHPGFTDETIWQGALLKLHGSIAWKRCLNPACCAYQCLVPDEQCRAFEPHECPKCSRMCSPALVMPTMNKNLKETPEIDAMWQAAMAAIENAESILIFGFSFPRSDELLIQSFRKAIETSKRLKKVGIIDLDPQAVAHNFRCCLPVGYHVEYAYLNSTKSGVPDWFNVEPKQLFNICN